MKKLLFTLTILAMLSAKAQEQYFVTLGFDPKLAISGAYSYDKTPVLNITFKTGTRFQSNFEGGLSFEYANLKPYYLSYGIFANKIIPVSNNISVSFGPELLALQRGRFQNNVKHNPFYTFALNSQLRINITPNFAIIPALKLVHRKDLQVQYDDHVFFAPNGYIEFEINLTR